MSSADYFSPAAIDQLVVPSDRYEVVAVTQTQEVDGERLIDVLDIAFTVTGRVGVFTFQFPLVGFQAFESPIDLSSEAAIIDAMYGIAV